jgi:hypothetical protein
MTADSSPVSVFCLTTSSAKAVVAPFGCGIRVAALMFGTLLSF